MKAIRSLELAREIMYGRQDRLFSVFDVNAGIQEIVMRLLLGKVKPVPDPHIASGASRMSGL